MASIAENIGDTAVAFETSIAVFNADPRFGEEGIGLFLLLSQFVFGFPFLFAFAFEWGDDLCIANAEALEATVCPHRKTSGAGELRLIDDLLVMPGAGCFFAYGENALGLGMGDGDMFAGMPLPLARRVLFLLYFIFGTVDGPLRCVREHSQFPEFGKFFQ